MKNLSALVLVSCLLAITPPAVAQQSMDYASASGRVLDPSGAAVPGARVSALRLETNTTATAVTDAEGRFRFPYLKVGVYEIKVVQDGFKEEVRQITATAGGAFEIPITLSLPVVDASVIVAGEAALLETARSQIAATIPERELRNLPLNGRNFLDLALLVPGVSPTNVNSTQLFPETSAVGSATLSVSSQRNLSNNFIVDGLSANDDAAALSGITYGVDAIEQVQVVTSGGQAELGRALGGYVNVVTKSGTNLFQGTGYLYVRDDSLNARNRLSGTTLPMDQEQFGGSVGGPLQANRTFFFTNVERRRLDQTGLTTISAAGVTAINDRLHAVGYPGSPVATGVYPNPLNTTNLLGKIDHQFSGRDQAVFRYALYDVDARNARGAGGLFAPTASSDLDNLDQTVSLSNALTLTSRTLLETRAQFAHADLLAPPSEPVGPAVTINGVATFGTLSTSPTGRVNRLYQVVNNLSHQRGAHAIRAGLDFVYNDDRITFPRAARGSYTFSSLANFLSGTYNNLGFTQTFGATEISQGNSNVGMYLQDEWKVASGVTLNLGARYDSQYLETIETDTDNVSPRAGAVWSPFASGRTLIRGSVGLFYDRVPLRAVANALLSAGNTTDVERLRQISVTLSPGQSGAPVFPGILSNVVPSGALPNLTTMDRHLQNASSRQVSIEVEQQLGAGTTISAAYQYLRGVDLLMSINQNVPTCVSAATNNGCRPNPDYANNSQFSAAGKSTYHGLHLSLTGRPSAWAQYRVSYTLSKAMNDVGEFFFSSPIDPFDLSKDWGRSDDDQRHRLVASGSATVAGFQLSSLLQAYSSLPYNITSGQTTLQGTAGRPIVNGSFIERNAGESTPFFTLSARISRSFNVGERLKLDAIVDAFNITNRQNVITRNTNFGSGSYPDNPLSTFGQITGVSDPRAFQFGVRARF